MSKVRFFSTWLATSVVFALVMPGAQFVLAIPSSYLCTTTANTACPTCAKSGGAFCHIPTQSYFVCASASSGDCNNVITHYCDGLLNGSADCSGNDTIFDCSKQYPACQ